MTTLASAENPSRTWRAADHRASAARRRRTRRCAPVVGVAEPTPRTRIGADGRPLPRTRRRHTGANRRLEGAMSNSIVLIHGLWMTPRSWEQFAERYAAAGHDVHASWPGLEGDVEALREDPSPWPVCRSRRSSTATSSSSAAWTLPRSSWATRSVGCSCSCSSARFPGRFGLSAAQPRGIRRLPLSTLRSGARILRNPATVTGRWSTHSTTSTTR